MFICYQNVLPDWDEIYSEIKHLAFYQVGKKPQWNSWVQWLSKEESYEDNRFENVETHGPNILGAN